MKTIVDKALKKDKLKSEKSKFEGRIVRIRGQIVEIEFDRTLDLPDFHDILTSPENEQIRLEHYAFKGRNRLYSLSLTQKKWLYRNMKIVTTGRPLVIPAGKGVLGRVFNLFGQQQDNKGAIPDTDKVAIYGKGAGFGNVLTSKAVIET